MKEISSKIMNQNILVMKEDKFNNEFIKICDKNYDYVIVLSRNNLPFKVFLLKKEKDTNELCSLSFKTISDDESINLEEYRGETFLVLNNQGTIKGVITSYEIVKTLVNSLKVLENNFDQVKTDLEAFMACSDDLACISDGSGSKVRISSSCEKIYGMKSDSLIGKNVKDLEKDGLYNPSATRMVIEEKKAVTVMQKTKAGKKLLVTATPFFDKLGNIKRVVSISKDITDEEKVKTELKQTKSLLQKYERELSSLRITHLKDSKLIYRSKAMEKLLEMVNRVANVESTVLIYGETGTGKEVLSKYIHNISDRSNGPFIKINCGAIPENLLEAELFGYEKGAFTGAKTEGKPGLIEIADKGTLLLDEISELPFSLQVKLLRVLQEREFTRVGGIKTISVDVKVIATSNKDLKELVKEGKFRQDLYYRINVVPVTIPPLRERVEDIPILSNNFLNIYNERYNQSKRLSSEVIDAFRQYSWPGNVRELENVIERVVVISEDNIITKKDLPQEFFSKETANNNFSKVHISGLMPLKEAAALTEFQLIKEALEMGGSTYKAAEILGIDQSTVVRKLKRYKSMF